MKLAQCPFCNPLAEEIVARNDLCYARWDRFPASKGHLLVLPFRHTPYFFSMTKEERREMIALIEACKQVIEENFVPDGYTIGINEGLAAGQVILHCHCHLIPRYIGDVPDPAGGVRKALAGTKNPQRAPAVTLLPGSTPFNRSAGAP